MFTLLGRTLALGALSLAIQAARAEDVWLEQGDWIELRIEVDDPVVAPEGLGDGWAERFPHRGKTLRFRARESGTHRVEVRALHLMPHLVVRNDAGTVVVEHEQEYGRVEAELDLHAGDQASLGLISRFGLPGRVEVRIGLGRADEPDRDAELARTQAFLDRGVESAAESNTAARALALGRRAWFRATHRDPASALEDARSAIDLARELGDDPLALLVLQWAAGALGEAGEGEQALVITRDVLAVTERLFGSDHPDVALALINLGASLGANFRLSEAISLMQRAVSIADEENTSLETLADYYRNLSIACSRAQRFEEAEQAVERAFELQELGLAADDPALGNTLLAWATLDGERGRYESAAERCEHAVELLEWTDDVTSLSTAYGQLGQALTRLDRMAEAESALVRSLDLARDRSAAPTDLYATSAFELGRLLRRRGRYEEAQEWLETALAEYESLHGPRHPWVAACLAELATLLSDLGLHRGAAEHARAAYEINRDTLGAAHSHTAIALGILAARLLKLGELGEARQAFERAIALLTERLGETHPEALVARGSYAALLIELRLLEDALRETDELIVLFAKAVGDRHERTLTAKYNRAMILVRLERFDDELLALRSEVEHFPRALDRALHLCNLGQAVFEAGDEVEAIDILRASLDEYERLLGADNQEATRPRHLLAQMLLERAESEQARALCEKNLAVHEREQGANHVSIAHVLHTLALAQADQGDHDGAWESARRAFWIRDGHVDRAAPFLSEGERFGFIESELRGLELLLGLLRNHPTPERERGARAAAARWKGRNLRELVASRARLLHALDEEQRARLLRLHTVQARLSRELSRREIPDQALHDERLARLKAERSALERGLASERDSLERRLEPGAVLPSGAVLVDFLVHGFQLPAQRDEDGALSQGPGITSLRVTAWVRRAGESASVRVPLGEAAAIQAALPPFVEPLARSRGVPVVGNEGALVRDAGAELRRLLWDPLAPHLEGAELVILAPDGFLATIPFEALPLEDGRYLIEERPLTYVQDEGALAAILEAEPMRAAGTLVAVGAVDYGVSPEAAVARAHETLRGALGASWRPLPGTARELDALDAAYRRAHPGAALRRLDGEAASEEALKSALPGATVAHIATHGYFQPEGLTSFWDSARARSSEERAVTGVLPGLLSGLVCAGANGAPQEGRDDGLLTAEEIGWLDLSPCELVVLSACETALGEARSGEGLMGLRRAFRLAGARAVISSLWSVGDESTAELMEIFYERLWQRGESKLDALRGAKLELIQRHGRDTPPTWAAFVLDGDWR